MLSLKQVHKYKGAGKPLSAADALKMRQTEEAPRAFAEEGGLPTLSNSELAVALESAVGFSARHNISEGLRPLIEQHVARLMAEQWRRANPTLAACWENATFEEQPGD